MLSNPNWPSKTGNPSGKGRGNNPAKKKSILIICCLLLLFPISISAQNKTYSFIGLQITYPSGCTIHGLEKESNIISGDACSFILSAVFSDGSEERMKVSACHLSTSALGLAILGLDIDDLTKEQILLWDVLINYSNFDGPLYSHLTEANNEGVGENYAFMDFSGRYYQETRKTEKLYYKPFKGRVYSRIIGNYLVSFVMQVPGTNNFNTLQKIANSLSYSY